MVKPDINPTNETVLKGYQRGNKGAKEAMIQIVKGATKRQKEPPKPAASRGKEGFILVLSPKGSTQRYWRIARTICGMCQMRHELKWDIKGTMGTRNPVGLQKGQWGHGSDHKRLEWFSQRFARKRALEGKIDYYTLGIPEKIYLVRVFVDMDKNPPEIVTAYKTSKIEKYWRKKP